MKRKFLAFMVTVCMIISLLPAGVYAESEINSQKQSALSFTFSQDEIERLAWLNNVDPKELNDALKAGPDENGRYSPFSNLKQLDNDVTNEELKSGITPNYGMVAVHYVGGNPVNPIIPFDTNIYLDRYISLPDGTSRSNYIVEDTGPGSLRTTYWIDIFFGGTANYIKAANFGIQKFTYNQMT